MKKIFLATAVIVTMFAFAPKAHAQWDGKGTKFLNAGVGLGSRVGGGLPVGISFDMGINENIAIGGYAGFATYTEDLVFFKYTYNNILIAGRGTYHLALVDNIDTYFGLMLGYNVASAKADVSGAPSVSAGGFIWGGIAGARYMFSDKFGAFAEIGNGVAWLQAGVAVKL